MSYQEKYLKYKNKYLALKAKYGHLLNDSTEESSIVPVSKSNLDLNESDERPINNSNIKVVNIVGGAKSSEPVPETETETTINNNNNSETGFFSSLFKQAGGKSKGKGKKSSKHFFDESDSDLSSSSTLSEAKSDSEFSYSETDW